MVKFTVQKRENRFSRLKNFIVKFFFAFLIAFRVSNRVFAFLSSRFNKIHVLKFTRQNKFLLPFSLIFNYRIKYVIYIP